MAYCQLALVLGWRLNVENPVRLSEALEFDVHEAEEVPDLMCPIEKAYTVICECANRAKLRRPWTRPLANVNIRPLWKLVRERYPSVL